LSHDEIIKVMQDNLDIIEDEESYATVGLLIMNASWGKKDYYPSASYFEEAYPEIANIGICLLDDAKYQ
jgi:hypothetical protein